MRDFIERLRAHPEHIRHRIALGTTVGFTGLVAVVWLGTLMTSGSLALNLMGPTSNNPTLASTSDVQGAVNTTQSNVQQLVGAVGAIFQGTTTPAKLTPIQSAETQQPSAPATDSDGNQNATNQTVIPF